MTPLHRALFECARRGAHLFVAKGFADASLPPRIARPCWLIQAPSTEVPGLPSSASCPSSSWGSVTGTFQKDGTHTKPRSSKSNSPLPSRTCWDKWRSAKTHSVGAASFRCLVRKQGHALDCFGLLTWFTFLCVAAGCIPHRANPLEMTPQCRAPWAQENFWLNIRQLHCCPLRWHLASQKRTTTACI